MLRKNGVALLKRGVPVVSSGWVSRDGVNKSLLLIVKLHLTDLIMLDTLFATS